MEKELREMLLSSGVVSETVNSLEEEKILSVKIFKALREEHFERLLPKLSIGQHALLLKIWGDTTDDDFLMWEETADKVRIKNLI